MCTSWVYKHLQGSASNVCVVQGLQTGGILYLVFVGFILRQDHDICISVYQGLIRTCSRPIVVETEVNLQDNYDDQEIDEKNQITYCDYLPLWSTLLDTASVKVNNLFCNEDKPLLPHTY